MRLRKEDLMRVVQIEYCGSNRFPDGILRFTLDDGSPLLNESQLPFEPAISALGVLLVLALFEAWTGKRFVQQGESGHATVWCVEEGGGA